VRRFESQRGRPVAASVIVVVVIVVMVMVMVVIIMMMIIVTVIIMVMMVVVVMIVILSHHDRLPVSRRFASAALILCAQDALGVWNGVQQFGERAGRLQH
jgi:hypothetical protein